ncbi:hypothetical protein Tco_0390943 [Tanacetum coccineum]
MIPTTAEIRRQKKPSKLYCHQGYTGTFPCVKYVDYITPPTPQGLAVSKCLGSVNRSISSTQVLSGSEEILLAVIKSVGLVNIELTCEKEHDGQSDGVIAPKVFGMISGCDSEDAIEEGAAKIYNLITGAETKEASTAGDAGEFAFSHWCHFESGRETSFQMVCLIADSRMLCLHLFLVDYTPLSDHIDWMNHKLSYGTKLSTSGDSNSVSNDFVSCDNSDKSSEVITNDFASNDSSVKSSEPKSNDSTSYASTSSVSTSESEAEIESNVGTPIQEPIIVQDLPSFFCNSSDKNENTSRTSCNKNGYFNKNAGHFRKNASSVSKLCFENPYSDAEDEGIFDSGCSRRGGASRILDKGTNSKTPTLDFENVYYGKDGNNSYSRAAISQICDKKNRVLFTDTDCLVLSKDFMLPDESMVLLRVPRNHNLYTINLNNLSPKGLLNKGSHRYPSYIDETPYTITEDSVRSQLQLADDGGIDDLPIAKIYFGMGNLRYVTKGKLTFYKNKFSPQWRFLAHIILHCLSTKSGSWDQFGSSLAVALICLSDGRKFNWSSYIFKGMVSNIGNAKKFLMYPRFLQTILGIETRITRQYHVFKLSSKLFANMKFNFEGQPMQLLAAMLPQDQDGEGAGVDAQDVPPPIPGPIPAPMPKPDQPQDHLSLPPRPPTFDPFTSTNVEDAPLGGSFHASPPRSTQAPPAIHTSRSKVHSLETKLKAYKQLFKDVVGKLVKKVKAMEVKLKPKKRKVVVSDSDQEEAESNCVSLDASNSIG